MSFPSGISVLPLEAASNLYNSVINMAPACFELNVLMELINDALEHP
jgi:hypothetical protein